MITFKRATLVTGGSKRIGKHISKFFVMNDWDLILHYNNSKVEAEETANELSLYSKNIKLYQADFTNYKDVENLVENLLLKELFLIKSAYNDINKIADSSCIGVNCF